MTCYGIIIQMKAIEQYFLAFESVDETLNCDHSNECAYQAEPSSRAVYYAVQSGFNFQVAVCG